MASVIRYNRAVAYDNLGEREKAHADYEMALRDESGTMRVIATEHEEVASLIYLDALGLEKLAQDLYLVHNGFVTGKKVPLSAVAVRFGLSEKEVKDILSGIEAVLSAVSDNRMRERKR